MIFSPNDELSLLNIKGRVGLTSGCFDLIHFYHVLYLEKCRAECDLLIVGVDSDVLLEKFKSKKPTIPDHHRAAMVAALRCVGGVFIMRNLEQFQEVSKFAHVIFKNQPTLYGQEIVGAEGKLLVIPDVNELQSTTEIVNRVRENKG